jgi:FkbM family methyltransferase
MKTLAKQALSRILKSKGYDLVYQGNSLAIQDYCATEYAKQSYLARILEEFQINCVIDVGANVGQYAQELRSIGYLGYIFSFEPVAATYATLAAAAMGDRTWQTFPVALGATQTQHEIHLFQQSSQFNSFLPPTSEANALFNTGLVTQQTEKVIVKTLDSIYPELAQLVRQNLQDECRTLIKLDTQGFDLEVVKGGLSTLKQAIVLQSELSFVPIYQHMPTYQESLDRFTALGFSVSNFFPIRGSDRGFTTLEFDCILVATHAL